MIPIMAASLRIWRLDTILRWADRRRAHSRAGEADPVQPIVRAVARAGQLAPYRGNCLSRSLTLFWLLRRRGLNAHLQLGARVRDGHFEAHAWVERDGIILNERADVADRFAPFPTPRVRQNAIGPAGAFRS